MCEICQPRVGCIKGNRLQLLGDCVCAEHVTPERIICKKKKHPNGCYLDTFTSLCILEDHLHPVMATVFPGCCEFLLRDNESCHKGEIIN